MNLGNIPRQVDVVIGLERLDKLIEHDDANLTATAQAGTRVAAFQEILGQRRQFLPVDPPHPCRATLGGMVAANINGPRRMLHGGLRDLVIGMKMVLATGEQIKAGGKVVKNVAGYDMCKLFVGSLGTLGIITEVTFKMAPLPQKSATLIAQGPLTDCAEVADDLSSSALLPAAVTLFNAEAAKTHGLRPEAAAVAIWTEGFAEAVGRHIQDVRSITKKIGLTSEILPDELHRQLWEQVGNFGTDHDVIFYRLTVPLSSMKPALMAVNRWSSVDWPAIIIAHAGSGTLWIQTKAGPESVEWFSRLTVLAQEHKGHAVMIAAPPQRKEGIDVWGPPPPSLAIMREIKRQFDPHGILNPGRFLPGL